jgi:hypothetical protein
MPTLQFRNTKLDSLYAQPAQHLTALEMLRASTLTKNEHWLYHYASMRKYYDLPARDMNIARGSMKPADVEFMRVRNAWMHHITVTNKWLRVDQKKCSWSVIPAHVKYAMWDSQREFGVNYNISEFIAKCK